jgi:esterase/lipase
MFMKEEIQWEFFIEQYKWLRQELLNKKDKQYQVTGLSIGGIATLLGLAFQYDIYALFLLIPLVESRMFGIYIPRRSF